MRHHDGKRASRLVRIGHVGKRWEVRGQEPTWRHTRDRPTITDQVGVIGVASSGRQRSKRRLANDDTFPSNTTPAIPGRNRTPTASEPTGSAKLQAVISGPHTQSAHCVLLTANAHAGDQSCDDRFSLDAPHHDHVIGPRRTGPGFREADCDLCSR